MRTHLTITSDGSWIAGMGRSSSTVIMPGPPNMTACMLVWVRCWWSKAFDAQPRFTQLNWLPSLKLGLPLPGSNWPESPNLPTSVAGRL